MSTAAETETTARAYCQELLGQYVGEFDKAQRDLLIYVLMEAYCEGGLAALRELDAAAEQAA